MVSASDSKSYAAPVRPFEYPWEGVGLIHNCEECLPWEIEFWFDDDPDQTPMIREWHAVGCDIWLNVDPAGPSRPSSFLPK